MTLDEIKELAGHREVSPWIIKLVQDCIEREKMYENQDLTLAHMVGFEKGKDYMKEKAAKVCEDLINEETCYVWIPDARGAINNCAAAIRRMK